MAYIHKQISFIGSVKGVFLMKRLKVAMMIVALAVSFLFVEYQLPDLSDFQQITIFRLVILER